MKNWKDLTVGKWQHIVATIEAQELEITRWLDILPVLEGKPRTYYEELPQSAFGKAIEPWKELLDTVPPTLLPKRWQSAGRKFVCVPEINKLKAAQLVDSSELGKDGNKPGELHLFLAIYWHEEGKGYDAAGFQERAAFIRDNMPMDIGHATTHHFFALWIALQPAILSYLNKRAAHLTGSPNNGTGTQRWTGWRRAVGRIGTFFWK